MNSYKKVLFLVGFLLTTGTLFCQCSFEKFFPYTHSGNYNIYQTSDKYYIVFAGATTDTLNPFTGQRDMIILKLDSCGQLVWKMVYGNSSQEDDMTGFAETTEGDYIFVGDAAFQQQSLNIRILKTTKDGDIIFNNFLGNKNLTPRVLAKNPYKNTYYIGGTTYQFGLLNPHPYLVEIDALGNIIREKIFTYSNTQLDRKSVRKILQQNSNSLYVFMQVVDTLFLVNTDSNFNVRWVKQPLRKNITPGADISFINACFSYDSSSIVIINNYDFINDSNRYRVDFAQLDLNAELIGLGGLPQSIFFNFPLFILPTADKGYITNNGSVTYLDSNLTVTKIDTFYTSFGPITFLFFIPLSQKSVYGMAFVIPEGKEYDELFVAKTDSIGRVTLQVPQPSDDKMAIKIYPNPAQNEVHIDVGLNNNCRIQIINLLGKICLEENITGTALLNIADVTNGLYLVNITNTTTGSLKSQKLLISRH